MTSPYHIKIAPTARQQLLDLDGKHRKIAVKWLETLAINPHPPGVKRVEGMTGLYTQLMNDLRFIYKVEEQDVLLLVIKA